VVVLPAFDFLDRLDVRVECTVVECSRLEVEGQEERVPLPVLRVQRVALDDTLVDLGVVVDPAVRGLAAIGFRAGFPLWAKQVSVAFGYAARPVGAADLEVLCEGLDTGVLLIETELSIEELDIAGAEGNCRGTVDAAAIEAKVGIGGRAAVAESRRVEDC